MDSLTAVLKALSDPTRRTLIDLLSSGGRSVGDLSQHFSMSRPAVSKHLSALRRAGLVASRRQGREQIYELDLAPLDEVQEWLGERRPTETPASRRRESPVEQGDGWRCW